MSAQNIQNPIIYQPVQGNIPVQTLARTAPVQNPQVQVPVNEVVQNNNMPRYSPLVQNGQVYPVALPMQNQQQPQKAGSVGAVNITINGVNPPGATNAVPQCAPAYIPYYIPQPSVNNNNNNITQAPKPQALEPKTDNNSAKLMEKKIEEKPEEKKVDKKPEKNPQAVVELTDDYFKLMEDNLNTNNKELKGHAVADILKRFKEDPSRRDNPKLIALLNLALQDDAQTVVYGALQSLENNYTDGNENTKKYLQAIVDKHDKFGNSDTAAEILVKLNSKRPELEQVKEQKIN